MRKKKLKELEEKLIDRMSSYLDKGVVFPVNRRLIQSDREFHLLMNEYKQLKSDKVEGFISVNVNEYLFLKNYFDAIDSGKTVKVEGSEGREYSSHATWYGYDIHTSDTVIKELNEQLIERGREDSKMYSRFHVLREMSIWDFMKWKKTVKYGLNDWRFIDDKIE